MSSGRASPFCSASSAWRASTSPWGGSPEGRLVAAAAILGGLVLVVLGFAVWRTPWKVVAPALTDLPSPQPTTEALARGLFSLEGGFVLPFEIASVLLLAAIIGAIVLVMERK